MTSDQAGADVKQHLRTLYRHRRLGGAAFAIPVVIAFAYAFTATPVYRATVRLLIQPENPNVVAFQEVITRRNQGSNPLLQTTQRDMLRGRSLARATLDRLGLWDHPEFGGGLDERFDSFRVVRRTLSSLRSAILPSPSLQDGPADAESRAESDAISILQDQLGVSGGRNSRVVTLTFTAFDPRLAADVVNTVARMHVERDTAFRNTSSKEASTWLQQRIAVQREKLEASELALQRYREEHGAVAVEDRQTIIVRELENLHSAVTEATMTRVASEARYRDLQAAQDEPDSIGRFPEILRNEVIQEQRLTLASLRRDRSRLADELGPRHPDMISIESSIREAEERLQSEVLAVVDSLRIEFQVASSQERQLVAELDRQTQEALALDRTGIEYGVLRREAESDRRLYESLLQRAAETDVTSDMATSYIRILDAAETPLRPFRPRRQVILLVGMLSGALLAFGLVFGVEYANDTVRNPEDVKTHLDVPFLGMVPDVSPGVASSSGDRDEGSRSESSGPLMSTEGIPANFAESIRTLRTAVIFSAATEGCRSVVLTSTIPGEGKSTNASNLAIVLAQMGLRTLLVDADLRNPRQHSVFGMDVEPGLSNRLVATAEESEVIHETSVANLCLVPAGRRPPDPAELLGSKQFASFLASCRERFDWMVVDTTPMLPVSDALIVSHAVGEVLFVVGTGTTSWRSAVDAMAKLREMDVHVLGTVLNKAELERHAYYYSRYYGRGYDRYYSGSRAS